MLVAALVLAQQPRTVTFSHPCAASAVVLEALGKAIGLPLKPSGSVMDDYLLLRFDETPVDVALKKLGDVANATWTESNGVRYLGRTKQQEDAGLVALKKRLAAAIADYVANDALRVTSWDATRTMSLMRETLQPGGDFDKQKAAALTDQSGPCRELLDEFLRTIGAEKLVALPDGETVFRWSPGKGEQRIPPGLRPKAELASKSVNAFAAAMRAAGVRPLGDFDYPGELRLGSSGQPVTPDWFSFRVRVTPGSLSATISPNGQNPSWYAQAYIRPDVPEQAALTAVGIEGAYRPSAMVRLYCQRLQDRNKTRIDETDPVAKEVVKWFEDGLSPEPIHLLLGAVLLEIAERAGRDVVAVYPNYHASYDAFNVREQTLYSDVLAELVKRGLDVDDEWMVQRPPAVRFRKPIATEALARFCLAVYKKGWADIDIMAQLAEDCADPMNFQSAQRIAGVLQPTQYSHSWILHECDPLTLRTYNSLPSSAKRLAREDWVNLPYEDLPSNVRQRFVAAFLAQGFGAVAMTTRNPDDSWNGFTVNGMFVGEKQRTASELQKSVLQVRLTSRSLLAAASATDGSRVFMSQVMTPEVAAKAYLDYRDSEYKQVDYGTLSELQAEQLQMRVKLASGEVLYFVYVVDSRNTETRYYPIADVPGEMGTKLRDEVKRLGG